MSEQNPRRRGLFSRFRKRPTNRLGGVRTSEALARVDQFIYEWPRIGTEHKKPVPENQPLVKAQMKYLKSFGIKFLRFSGSETYGQLWKVSLKNKRTGLKEVLVCKVLSLNTFDANKYRVTTVKEAVTAMFHEITILRQLSQQNIIKLIDVLRIPDSKTGFQYSGVCMLMEDTQGSLEQLIHQPVAGLLLERDCKEWFGQIAEAVRYLHYNNVVHMNIKPESIRFVIKNKKVFKLCDFCYAIDFGEGMPSTIRSDYILQGKCMAPEVLGQGFEEEYDTKPADIYSLSLTLIVALIGLRTDPKVMLNHLRMRDWDKIRYTGSPPSRQLIELLILTSELAPKDRLTIDEVVDHQWLNS